MLNNRRCSSLGILSALVGILLSAPARSAADPVEIIGGLLTSVEVYNNQVSASNTTVRYYSAFDEAFELGVTSLTLKIDGGAPESITPNPIYGGEYKRRQDYSTDTALLAARPITSSYVYTLNNNPSDTITNTGPTGVSFSQGLPATPLFSINGVSGTWSTDNQGRGIFSFNPAGVTNFTVTLNNFVVSASDMDAGEARYEFRYNVYDQNANYAIVGEGGDFLTTLGAYSAPQLTFTAGVSAFNDGDPSTFGFSAGTALQIEGEFFNHFNFAQDPDGYINSFVFGTTTAFALMAIPEPATFAQLLGLIVLTGVLIRRRRH